MRLGQVGALRAMRQRQAEEPGEADGLDPRIEAFQRAPEHLGAHVDAKGRLQRRARFGRLRAAVQCRGQVALVRSFGGVLQDGPPDIVIRRGDGVGMGSHGFGPGPGQAGQVGQQRLVPDQPDRQQRGGRGVMAAGLLGPPVQPARVLGPAAHVHEQPVKGRFGRRACQAEGGCGAQDGAVGAVRRAQDMGAEPGQPGDFGGQVIGGPFAPGGEGILPRPRGPERLAPVEMPRRPEADRPVDDRGPVGAGVARGEVGHGGQRPRPGHVGRTGQRAQGRDILRLARAGGGGEGGAKVGVGDAAGRDGLGMGAALAQRLGPRDPAQPRRRRGQVFPGLAEEGVDRHGRVQRKGRGQGAGRGLDRGEDFGVRCLGRLVLRHQHRSAPCQPDLCRRSPPMARSSKALR